MKIDHNLNKTVIDHQEPMTIQIREKENTMIKDQKMEHLHQKNY